MSIRLLLVIILSLFSADAFGQSNPESLDGLIKLSNSAIEVYNAQLKQEIPETEERRLDNAVTRGDSEELHQLLSQFSTVQGLEDIYEVTATSLQNIQDFNGSDEMQWLINCAENEYSTRAHKCSVSLASIHLSKFEKTSLLDWAIKASEISSAVNSNQPRYWYQQYQSQELLLIAFIYDRNLIEAVEIGSEFVRSAQKAGVELDSFALINNIAHLAAKEIGPEAALKVLAPAEGLVTSIPDKKNSIILYSLGKNNMLAGKFEEALRYYAEFNKIESREDYTTAAQANLSYIYSMLGMYDDAEISVKTASEGLQGSMESALGINVLKARKNIAIHENRLQDALEIDSEIDRIDDLLDEKDLSANRNRLSKNLQVTGERLKRERDKLQFDAQLSAQQAKASRTQLLLSLCALVFLIGLVTYVFRSFRKEKRLNAEIKGVNTELEKKNKELYIAHANVTNTFEQLQIAHRQAMAGQEAKQKFIGVVGHELRTPLNPIINLSEVLEAKESDPKDKALLKAIKNAGKRLHIIVENMLAISSADKDSQVFIELVDVVYEATTVVEEFIPDIKERNEQTRTEGKYLNVNIYKHPELKKEHVSNKIIYRSIIRNLFDNAVKFTTEGEISVHLQLRQGGRGFKLEIRDTGQGMDTDKIEEFMRPFEQAEMGLGRSHEGAGLGLAVVHKYCEQLGAKMQIKSTVGKGTRITIDFPEPAHESETGKLLKVA